MCYKSINCSVSTEKWLNFDIMVARLVRCAFIKREQKECVFFSFSLSPSFFFIYFNNAITSVLYNLCREIYFTVHKMGVSDGYL